MSDLLLQEIIKNVPHKFFAGLAFYNEWAYREAYESSFNDVLLDEESAFYQFPHRRRAIYDTMMHKLALDCGCDASKEANVTGNFKYTLVKTGNIYLAQSHVNSSITSLRWSHFREQHASINYFAEQLSLKLSNYVQPIKPSDFFALILHSTHDTDHAKPGFLKIAVPDVQNNGFIKHYQVNHIMEYYPQPPSYKDGEKDFAHLVKWKKQVAKRKIAS